MGSLLIDIGNSSTTLAQYEEKMVSPLVTLPTPVFESVYSDYLLKTYRRVVVSSVVPRIDQKLKSAHSSVVFIDASNIPLLKIKMNEPREVGADRLVNALGAYDLAKKSCLIVDSGTAVTFCYVDKEGVYQGGGIFPGMTIASQALHLYTAKIPLIHVAPVTALYGKSTKEAVQIGLYRGFIYLINGMIYDYKQVDPDVAVIGTGGGLAVLQNQLKLEAYIPDLIFRGLALCADQE